MHFSFLSLITALSVLVQLNGYALHHNVMSIRIRRVIYSSEIDGAEVDSILKQAGPVWTNTKVDSDVIEALRKDQAAQEENLYREYPFVETQLPVLPDCNNYYSGKFGDYFWHQNADQVLVYIPLEETVTSNDIEVEFKASSVSVSIKGEQEISFKCLEKIIPDGSFWVFETGADGKRYLQLDLEKRFRMINWNSLFGEPKKPVSGSGDDSEKKAEMLQKLFSANKGMSRLTGKPAESIEEMQSNEDLVKMLGQKYFPDPQVIGTEDGEPLEEGEIIDVESVESVELEAFQDKNEDKADEKLEEED